MHANETEHGEQKSSVGLDASLNTSWLARGGEGRCRWAIGKPIWLVSLLRWMRAARSLSGDWTTNWTANWTAPCLPSQLIKTRPNEMFRLVSNDTTGGVRSDGGLDGID